MRTMGWLLDAYIDGGQAILWFKAENCSVLRLTDRYRPDFYAEPSDGACSEKLEDILLEHPNVADVGIEEKYCSLDAEEKTRVLHILVDETGNFRRVLRDVESTHLFKAFYNVDLLHIQRYLFQKGLAPTSKVRAEHDLHGLTGFRIIDDSWEVDPPPFTTYLFSIEPPDRTGSGVIRGINLYEGDLNPLGRFRGDEAEILRRFERDLAGADPDIMASPRIEADLKRLHLRAGCHGLRLQIGREETGGGLDPPPSRICRGRIPLDLGFYRDYGVAGLVERARFTYAPPGLSARWPAGKTIDSRQCYEAMKRGILIPRHGFYVEPKTAVETLMRDRGGFTLAPEAGLHENVAELDYESMFPQIILRDDVSYETVGEGPSRWGRGLLGAVAEEPLERRLYFKHLKRRLPQARQERRWCDQRQKALKGVLVCIYGYSGCFANRFGNVATFEEVNLLARERLVETLNIALDNGFRVIYADTDSVFVKKPGAARSDYEELARLISAQVGLPIALDHHYKFLVLMTRETDSRLEVAKRYFGKLHDGGLHYRGIELRRHDSPPFIKGFQEELMRVLFEADSAEEVWRERLPVAVEYVREACSRIRERRVGGEGLVVSKCLRKSVDGYGSSLPHVTAARQLSIKGVEVRPGDLVDFLYVEAGHRNPYRRVVPVGLVGQGWRGYDRAKYVDLLLDAAETILGAFGFDRRSLERRPRQTDLLEVI